MIEKKSTEKDVLNQQKQHWQQMFTERVDMFGISPSLPARKAMDLFKKEGKFSMLELGGGQGRDTLFFAKNGFQVQVLEYSQEGVDAINQKANELNLTQQITATCHDIRHALPFADNSLDCCYSHMLYCMALTTAELEFLSQEIRRVLKPDGLNIYTARHTEGPDFEVGIHRGEALYQSGKFIVHFFSREQVEKLAKGYEIVNIDEFEEGNLPRKLFYVTLKKVEP